MTLRAKAIARIVEMYPEITPMELAERVRILDEMLKYYVVI